MKTKCSILILALGLVLRLSGAASNDLASVFKQGLLEEEANRNLEAAIRAYQQVVTTFDKDRRTAATAAYRLGECYRKLGRTNEAVAQFERVVREFADDDVLVSISRNNLLALRGPAATTPDASPGADPLADAARAERKRLYAEEIKVAETQLDIFKKQFEGGRIGQTELLAQERELLRLRREAASVDIPGATAKPRLETVMTDEEEAEIRRIQVLVQNSPDLINALDNEGKSPLHRAASRGQRMVVQHLLDHGADVNQPCRTKETALHLAATVGHNAVVKLLLERKANVDARDNAGWTPLYSVAGRGFKTLGETLLDHGADVNARALDGRSPLHRAADAGSLEFVSMLLKRGARIDAIDNAGTQPLMSAAASGHVPVIHVLIERGASVNATNKAGASALLFAVARQHADAVQTLLGSKADPNLPGTVAPGPQPIPTSNVQREPVLPLEHAVGLKDAVIAGLLLDSGANPDGRVGDHLSPLQQAVLNKHTELTRLLLQHKADPNEPTPDGYAPLSAAMTMGARELARLLLEGGANPNVADPERGTALHRAVGDRMLDVARLLIERGADVNAARRDTGITPLHLAAASLSLEMVSLLLENRADINARDLNGATPLDALRSAETNRNTTFISFDVASPPIPMAGPSGFRQDPARSPRPGQPATSSTASEIGKLLRDRGARDDLPRMDRITLGRAASGYSRAVFIRGTNDWSHYTLLELLAVEYGFLSPFSRGGAVSNAGGAARLDMIQLRNLGTIRNSFGVVPSLQHPDLARLVIRRPTPDGSGWIRMDVDAQAILQSADGCRDVPLFWGDEVEVPETDHPVNEIWPGLSVQAIKTFKRCLTKQVTISAKVNGETKTVSIGPRLEFTREPSVIMLDSMISNQSMTLLPTLMESKMVRASSDLTRVKIRRKHPAAGAPAEWAVACPVNLPSRDLWLDDGDEIEIPDRP